ncbi:TPA: Down-regulator of transcription 1 [Trebouxia sp. C0004]
MEAESDVALPRSTMAQKIREAFPSELRVAGTTMDLMIECCTEFIQLVTSEANEICAADSKATMNPEHIIKALQQLEFSEFEDELTELLEQFKQENKDAGKQKRERKKRKDDGSLTEAEAIALQQQLFNQAKEGTAAPAIPDAAALAEYQRNQQQDQQL